MTLPPTIPTSFVPNSASASTRRYRTNYGSAFQFFAYGVFALAVLLALSVFAYGRILASAKDARDAELAKAEASIDPTTVEGFVRLRNRLTSSKTLLNNHPAFSGFFAAVEKLLPANARFATLTLSSREGGGAMLEAAGVAKNFNVLAALSNAFALDGNIKDAIFSNITINAKDNSVSFSLTAALHAKLIAFKAQAPAAPARAASATTTAATSTSALPPATP